mmetsp:Transcript_1215/g.1099  ORF Transcript_1215/g.1099 Transcript_1215/m.1099 type:complete len:154 (+) Transcript_1215:365-826(+)
MLKEQPEKVRFTLLDRALDKIGLFGSERIIALKDAFRFIIDNICPLEAKGLFSCFTIVTIEDWEAATNKRLNKREKKEYLKTVEDYDEDLIDFMMNEDLSKNLVEFWMKAGEGYMSKMQNLKIHIHRLVKIRNKILSTLKSLEEHSKEGGITT